MESGRTIKFMEEDSSFSKMEHIIKVASKKISHSDRVDMFITMAAFTKDN